jgi:hypothetical protein
MKNTTTSSSEGFEIALTDNRPYFIIHLCDYYGVLPCKYALQPHPQHHAFAEALWRAGRFPSKAREFRYILIEI